MSDIYTELEWALRLQSPATGSDVYEFRVYAGSTPLDVYTVTPQLTVSGATTAAVPTATIQIAGQTLTAAGSGAASTAVPVATVRTTGQTVAAAGAGTATVAVPTALQRITGQVVTAAGTGTASTAVPAADVRITGQAVTAAGAGATSTLVPAAVVRLTGQAPVGTGASTGSAVRFDTDPEYYQRSGAGLSAHNFTMACWMYRSVDTNDYEATLTVSESSSIYLSLGSGASGDSLILWDGGGTGAVISGGFALNVGTWYYVAATFSYATTTSIVYAAAEGTTSLQSGIQPSAIASAGGTTTLWIGTDNFSDQFNGRIAQVKVWDAVLTQAELEAEMRAESVVRTSNLWAYYSFRDGPQTLDESGNARTLSLTGTTTAEAGPPMSTAITATPPAAMILTGQSVVAATAGGPITATVPTATITITAQTVTATGSGAVSTAVPAAEMRLDRQPVVGAGSGTATTSVPVANISIGPRTPVATGTGDATTLIPAATVQLAGQTVVATSALFALVPTALVRLTPVVPLASGTGTVSILVPQAQLVLRGQLVTVIGAGGDLNICFEFDPPEFVARDTTLVFRSRTTTLVLQPHAVGEPVILGEHAASLAFRERSADVVLPSPHAAGAPALAPHSTNLVFAHGDPGEPVIEGIDLIIEFDPPVFRSRVTTTTFAPHSTTVVLRPHTIGVPQFYGSHTAGEPAFAPHETSLVLRPHSPDPPVIAERSATVELAHGDPGEPTMACEEGDVSGLEALLLDA